MVNDMSEENKTPADDQAAPTAVDANQATEQTPQKTEIGGPAGPEPTRFGDWEKAGRCSDF